MPQETNALDQPPTEDAKPCAMVIFGAGGDLTKRLVVPALYNLAASKLLPQKFRIIGVDLADLTTDAWEANLHTMMKEFTKPGGEFQIAAIDDAVWGRLKNNMEYLRGDFSDPDTFKKIGAALDKIADETESNVLFYLAVADRFFGPIVEQVAAAGLADQQDGKRWRRVIVEKPFGHDLASARALNAQMLKVLGEDQIYRIDHFLGKDAVQSMMALRFANGLFEPIWNRDHIDHVQITVSETVGVEKRGHFYEKTGALRDMIPNHLFQLLMMTSLEPPASFGPDAMRNRKVDVLNAVLPIKPDHAVRGQYVAGELLGQQVTDYRHEPDVASDSPIETYVALKLGIDSWRWAGVPFYIRTGKRMTKRWTEIAICFRPAPLSLFRGTDVTKMSPNWLVIQIAPDSGISLQFQVKKPGQTVLLSPVRMHFAYDEWFPANAGDGYETLLHDCMIGDATLFQRADMVEAAWHIVQPILDAWADPANKDLEFYPAGSAGPTGADTLLARDGRAWRPIGTMKGKAS